MPCEVEELLRKVYIKKRISEEELEQAAVDEELLLEPSAEKLWEIIQHYDPGRQSQNQG